MWTHLWLIHSAFLFIVQRMRTKVKAINSNHFPGCGNVGVPKTSSLPLRHSQSQRLIGDMHVLGRAAGAVGRTAVAGTFVGTSKLHL